MKSGGSRQKKTRHLPTRGRSSPGRSLRDFTSPWPSRRNVPGPHRSMPGRRDRGALNRAPLQARKTTRRITARAGAGLRPRGHRRPVPRGQDPAWPQSRHRGFPAHPVPLEKKWPPEPRCPEGHPRAIEGGCDRGTCFNYSFKGDQPIPAGTSSAPSEVRNHVGDLRRSPSGAVGLGGDRRVTGGIAARA
jgi:hypothetical protein